MALRFASLLLIAWLINTCCSFSYYAPQFTERPRLNGCSEAQSEAIKTILRLVSYLGQLGALSTQQESQYFDDNAQRHFEFHFGRDDHWTYTRVRTRYRAIAHQADLLLNGNVRFSCHHARCRVDPMLVVFADNGIDTIVVVRMELTVYLWIW